LGPRLSAPMFPVPSAGRQHSKAARKPVQRSTGLPSRTRTAPLPQRRPVATPVAAAPLLPPTAMTSPRQVAAHRPAVVRTDAPLKAGATPALPAVTPRAAALAVPLPREASAAAARPRGSAQQPVLVAVQAASVPQAQAQAQPAATRLSGPPTPGERPAVRTVPATVATAAAPAVPPAAARAVLPLRRRTNAAAAKSIFGG
jgi:translation initiation factor IF-2